MNTQAMIAALIASVGYLTKTLYEIVRAEQLRNRTMKAAAGEVLLGREPCAFNNETFRKLHHSEMVLDVAKELGPALREHTELLREIRDGVRALPQSRGGGRKK